MTIERKSIVDQIEITRSGFVQVKVALLLVDGDTELSSKWHRTAFDPSIENAALMQMYALNQHLLEMGEKPISQEDVDKVVAHGKVASGK